MYANELLDAYKKAKNYVQDKQIAHDLNLSPQKLSNVRKGIRYLTESEALFIANEVGLDKEMVIVFLAADKAKTYEAQSLWNKITKKYNGLGLTGITTSYMAFMMAKDGLFSHLSKCVLCVFMFNLVLNQLFKQTSIFRGLHNEISPNDQELYFS